MRWETLMIQDHEFLVRAVDGPVREVPVIHQCVCLLATLIVSGENAGRVTQDKCHATILNPDQAFCDDCMENEHHLADNQLGLGRHLHKEGKRDT